MGIATAVLLALLAALFTAGPAAASGTPTASWSPSSPTNSTPVTVTGSVSGCGAGNASMPSLYDYITGPGGYSNNQYLGSSTSLSNGGDTASATVSLGTLPAGTYAIQFYGRGTPCFASSFNFTWSSVQNMVVTAGVSVPGAPSAAAATANADGSVGLTWTAPAANGATITAYTVTPTPACPGCAGLTVSGNPAAAATTVTGLALGTSYTFTVTATNSAGTGSASLATNSVVPATVPATPNAPAASATGASTVSLSWSAPAANGATVTGYTVTPTPACPGCSGLTVTGNPAATTAAIGGLATATSYTFTVTAANSVGAGSASAASSAVVPAAAPGTPNPTATANSDATVTLAWAPPADNGAAITGYTVTPAPACPGCSGLTVTGNPSSPTTTISGLSAGVSYTFAVTATNAAGTSAAGGTPSVVVASASPPAPGGQSAAGSNPSSADAGAALTAPLSPLATRPSSPRIAGVWISSARAITDPYLINERDLAALVNCAGFTQCTVTLGASVRLGASGSLERLPSATVAITGGQAAIVRLRDTAALRARIRAYLASHRRRRLTIAITLRFARPGAGAQSQTYKVTLRTLPGLR